MDPVFNAITLNVKNINDILKQFHIFVDIFIL
jgi:hypothetical protein